jgi:aminoglycoside phosphotransferase (APT) family kinase protein
VAKPDLAIVPEEHRDKAAAAIGAAFGPSGASSVHAVGGGASGALTYRVETTSAGPHLLRLETLRGPLRNPHQYECMQIAADAGIAPPIRFVDGDAGLVIMPFIEQRPISDLPGGPPALATAMASLLARLHATATFPSRGDHLENLARLLAFLPASGRVAPGLLDRHAEAFERLRAAYPWAPDTFVSAHNDPNQFNVLYDGDRLWLIDWETAVRNDPMVDVATACAHVAPTPELRELVLRTWLGHEPDALVRAKLALMTLVTQLFAGCILLTIIVDPATSTHTDLEPLSLQAFGHKIETGELVPGTPGATHAFAKIALRSFADGMETPEVEEALAIAAGAPG